MRNFARNNGLSIVLFAMFAVALVGQYLTGMAEFNDDRKEHGKPPVSSVDYLGEGHFVEAVFENWESEFLQMGMYVVLTIFLYQKGSSESKEIGQLTRVDIIPEESRNDPKAPWPVRRGGLWLKLYQNSLSLVLFLLFAVSFALHAAGGAKVYSQEQIEHGEPPATFTEYLGTSRFWFESFQNWQSEFLSIGLMVTLSIFLRQKGSPESKPVDAAYGDTGGG